MLCLAKIDWMRHSCGACFVGICCQPSSSATLGSGRVTGTFAGAAWTRLTPVPQTQLTRDLNTCMTQRNACLCHTMKAGRGSKALAHLQRAQSVCKRQLPAASGPLPWLVSSSAPAVVGAPHCRPAAATCTFCTFSTLYS